SKDTPHSPAGRGHKKRRNPIDAKKCDAHASCSEQKRNALQVGEGPQNSLTARADSKLVQRHSTRCGFLRTSKLKNKRSPVKLRRSSSESSMMAMNFTMSCAFSTME